MNRKAWLLGGSTNADHILEIGPSHNPIAAKAAGWRTHVVDHAAQDELRAKYTALGVDTAPIEVVDTVWVGGPLHAALPAAVAGTFSRLIASHVIEHIPELVGFFESAARVLMPDGVVALAVPDQRHCFDFFKPPTTTGDVLEAYGQGRSRHARHTLWNHTAYSVNLHGDGVWGDVSATDLAFVDSFEAAANNYKSYGEAPDTQYIDSHAWQFTPARFRLVMLELGQLGLVDWQIVELEPNGAEFLCALRRGVPQLGPGALQRERMRLLYLGLAETRAQIDRALGGAGVVAAVQGGANWGALSLLRRPESESPE